MPKHVTAWLNNTEACSRMV